MTAEVRAFAPAKINLTLHITGQREDGYHLLDSLVGFADIGDEITARAADRLSLNVAGPMAKDVPEDGRNLMIKAARLMSPDKGADLHLVKNLPPASGIGGGSSDAAATLRALSELWNMPLPSQDQVLALGADLPVCLAPAPQRMQGIGDILSSLPSLPPCDIVLVNPGVAVSTPAIFKSLTSKDNPPMPHALPTWPDAVAFAQFLKDQRNDMQAAAQTLAPEIVDVLGALSNTGSLIARMSGSGATCFALFDPSTDQAQTACDTLRAAHPHWWIKKGRLL